MKDVIVAGGTGFIGRALAARLRGLVEPGRQVIAVGSKDVDLTHSEATFRWAEHQARSLDVSHVFHAAALYQAGGWPAKHPATQFFANMAINVNLLEAWKRCFPKARLTSVVSYCIYPDHDQPHPESELYGTEPEGYLYSFAFTKKGLLIGQRAYAQEFGLSAAGVVLPTLYGPGDNFTENSHVMGALLGKFWRAARGKEAAVEIWGDGAQEREFLYIDDAVDAVLLAAQRATSPYLNFGTGEAVRVRDIAELIRADSKFGGELRYLPQKFSGARRRVLATDLARGELGWAPRTSLAEGVRRTLAFLDRNPA